MDANKFMDLFNSSSEEECDLEKSKEAVRQSLNGDGRYYYDISGDGTVYYRSGARNGIGFASCTLTILPDGLATVRVTSLAIPQQYEHSIQKLCGSWNSRFKLRGLKVEDNKFVFETAPFDPVSGRFNADEACGLALSTVHHYASALLALEAGTDPWDLIDLYEEKKGQDDGGDDGGTSVSTLEEVRDLLQSMRDTPRSQTV